MNLFSFVLVVLVFLTSALSDQIEGHFWENDADYPTSDEIRVDDLYERLSLKPETWRYGKLDDYIRNQKDIDFDKSYTDKIVGGTLASQGEIPWQASMKVVFGRGQSLHSCGAVIISPFWLLSAAHCYYAFPKLVWQVVVGEHHLYRDDKSEQTFPVDSICVHQNFSNETSDNDIALIRVKPSSNGTGIVFNKFAQPIRLPNARTSLKKGTNLLVSGWGGTKPCVDCQQDLQLFSKVLLKTKVPIIDRKTCQRLYRQQYISTRMFCAGFLKGQIDACLGDSGGPAVYKQSGRYVLYGIVSWGDGCALPNKPGVYTRVTKFLPWIQATMRSNN